uniref:PiggyBac transposable element-derived protein domain-containing protein n=1 Tax=Glossina palpalis gambiensis TaxID=67801 RepID=A0A1B0BCH6_9MUSC
MKSRTWYIRLFYHMIDMAVIISWILLSNLEIETESKKHRDPTKPVPPKYMRSNGRSRDEKQMKFYQ